jgi:hypothetical protein
MVTLEDAKSHLRIDESDEMIDANVARALGAAHQRMLGAVGSDVETYLPEDPRIDQLVLIYTQENYDGGSLSEKEIRALKHLRDDLEPQLRLDLRAAKEEAGVI